MDPRELHDFVPRSPSSCRTAPHLPLGEEWEVFCALESGCSFSRTRMARQMVTMKVDPQEGRALVEAYDDVGSPGYHLNKRHWVTVLSPVRSWKHRACRRPLLRRKHHVQRRPHSPRCLPDPDAPHYSPLPSRCISAEEVKELIISSYLLVIAKMAKKDGLTPMPTARSTTRNAQH